MPVLEIIRHPSPSDEREGWLRGFQVAIDGKLAPMFDLHKSRIQECRNAAEYEQLLCESGIDLLQALSDGVIDERASYASA